jgi:DNA-binding HxlR family transcriptional regulator
MLNHFPGALQCGLPSALEAMGEKWSFLILRGALSGIRHFEDFQSTLGIARNILANRLTRLVEKGIMVRQPMSCDRRKVEYRLTDKGNALAPVMIALRQWGEEWECGVPSVPVLADRRDNLPIQPIKIHSHDGRVLGLGDLVWVYPDEIASVGSEEIEAEAVA